MPRPLRLFLAVLALVAIPTLYLAYPSPSSQSPEPHAQQYEAGGIDSEHWRDPIEPQFDDVELEAGRAWDDEMVVAPGPGASSGSASDVMSPDASDEAQGPDHGNEYGTGVLHGGVIMPKLENATAKAELGRAAWRVLHLMTLRYPDNPTPDDRQALKSYFHLFSRLYPCGECAAEFQALLKQYPPQTSSRKAASLWLCHVHNQVNERLGKPEFDCLTLDATYDCGCGDEPVGAASGGGSSATEGEATATGLSVAGSSVVGDGVTEVDRLKEEVQDDRVGMDAPLVSAAGKAWDE